MLEVGPCVLAPTSEDGFAVMVVDSGVVLGEDDFAVGVTYFTDTNDRGRKGGHDVARPGCVV